MALNLLMICTGLNALNKVCSRYMGWAGVSCGSYRHRVSYLVSQVFGWAAYVSIQVRNVDKLGDASFSGCLCNLLRDGHKDILKAIVPVTKQKQRGKITCLQKTSIHYKLATTIE